MQEAKEINRKKRIGILRGGTEGYHSSLKKGGDMILYFHENMPNQYKPVDILVDKDHIWHFSGIPISPSDLIHKVDIVWNTAHPSFSNILDSLSIPNISPSSFSHGISQSKEMLREHMKKVNVALPRSIVLPVYQDDFDAPRDKYSIKKAKEIHAKFSPPWIIRSFTEGVDMAVHVAQTFPQLVSAIEDGVRNNTSILIEEFIPGKVASVHSVPNFRNEEVYVFPPINVFGELSKEEKEKLCILAKELHDHVSGERYLKSNFLLNKKGKVYLLDLDFVPNLNPHSHFSQACESVGTKVYHVVEHILNTI